ncbi:MAG: response regulator [Planctomycetes bacterium]|nr:response regulator [Planctomycetota bacterium]
MATTVLVIEDERSSQMMLRELLEQEGYSVQIVETGEDALASVNDDPPDLVICDLLLPKMDGYEVCRRLKASHATRFIPIVVVTGLAELQQRLDALDAGADDILTKPVNPLEVIARIRGLVRNRSLTLELESAQNVVFALATAIEQKDSYTEGHGERVGMFSRSLAEHLGLSQTDILAVQTGGLLHDVGKIGCPDAILNKPGPLTRDEFEVIKRHPVAGWEICRHLKSLGDATLHCIRNHHERLDGSGYPDSLTSGEIPLTTRITTICDVFDALATARAYKPAFPLETCYKILREESERGWWDKELVRAFIDMMGERELFKPAKRAVLKPLFERPAP